MTFGRTRTSRSSRTKEQIVSAAAKLLAERGYDATSLDDVADSAGLTKGTIYYHFDSKEVIYAEIVTRYLRDALGRLDDRVANEPDTVAAIAGIIEDQLSDTMDDERRYIHYQEILRVADETRALVREAQRQYERAFAEVIERGQREGKVVDGDPTVMAMIVIGAVGRVSRWYRPDGRVHGTEVQRLARDVLLRGLLRPESV